MKDAVLRYPGLGVKLTVDQEGHDHRSARTGEKRPCLDFRGNVSFTAGGGRGLASNGGSGIPSRSEPHVKAVQPQFCVSDRSCWLAARRRKFMETAWQAAARFRVPGAEVGAAGTCGFAPGSLAQAASGRRYGAGRCIPARTHGRARKRSRWCSPCALSVTRSLPAGRSRRGRRPSGGGTPDANHWRDRRLT